jgi:hypothetical protein
VVVDKVSKESTAGNILVAHVCGMRSVLFKMEMCAPDTVKTLAAVVNCYFRSLLTAAARF